MSSSESECHNPGCKPSTKGFDFHQHTDNSLSTSGDELPDPILCDKVRCSERFKPHDWRHTTTDGVTRVCANTRTLLQRVERLLDNPDYVNLLDAYIAILEERDRLAAQLAAMKKPLNTISV